MPHVIEGVLDAKGKRFGIVASRFNEFITQKLVEGALDAFRRMGASEDDVTIVWVPGSFEIPGVARRFARSGKVDAVIGVGALISRCTRSATAKSRRWRGRFRCFSACSQPTRLSRRLNVPGQKRGTEGSMLPRVRSRWQACTSV